MASKGGLYFSTPRMTHRARCQGFATARPEPPKLTNRERSVLELVAEGKLNREIASEIGITTRVVETYVRRLLAKTGTSNRTQLLRRALQIGLLSPDPPYQYM